MPTVSVATELVTTPRALETITEKPPPLEASATATSNCALVALFTAAPSLSHW